MACKIVFARVALTRSAPEGSGGVGRVSLAFRRLRCLPAAVPWQTGPDSWSCFKNDQQTGTFQVTPLEPHPPSSSAPNAGGAMLAIRAKLVSSGQARDARGG